MKSDGSPARSRMRNVRRPSAMTPAGQTRVQLDAEFQSHTYGKLYSIVIPADSAFAIAELRWKNYFAAMGESFIAGSTSVASGDVLTSVNGKTLQHLPFNEVKRRIEEAKQDAYGGDLRLVLRACNLSLTTTSVVPSTTPAASLARRALPQSDAPLYTPWAPREPQEYSPSGRAVRQSAPIIRPHTAPRHDRDTAFGEFEGEGYDVPMLQGRKPRRRRLVDVSEEDQASLSSGNGHGSTERMEELFRAREEVVKRWERAVDEKEKELMKKEGMLKGYDEQGTPRTGRSPASEPFSPSSEHLQQELADKDRELTALRQQLRRKEALLNEREQELLQEQETFERRAEKLREKERMVELEFDGERKSVEEWLADVRERRKKARQDELDMQRRIADVEEQEAASKAMMDKLERRTAKVTQREETLKEQESALDKAEKEALLQRKQLQAREQELKSEELEWKSKQELLQVTSKSLETRERRLKEEEDALAKRKEELDEQLHQAMKRSRGSVLERDGVKRQQEDLEERFQQLRREAEKNREDKRSVDALKLSLAEREAELTNSESRLRLEEQRLQALRKAIDEKQRELEAQRANFEQQEAELEKEKSAVFKQKNEVEKQLAEAQIKQKEADVSLATGQSLLQKKEDEVVQRQTVLERKEKLLVELLPEGIDLKSFELMAEEGTDLTSQDILVGCTLPHPSMASTAAALKSLNQKEKEVKVREKAVMEKEQHLLATERSLDAREAALARFQRAGGPKPQSPRSGASIQRTPMEEKYRMALEDRAATHRILSREIAELRAANARKSQEILDLVGLGETLKGKLEKVMAARRKVESATWRGEAGKSEGAASIAVIRGRLDSVTEELVRAREDAKWWQRATKKEEAEGLHLRAQVKALKEQLKQRGVDDTPLKDKGSPPSYRGFLARSKGTQTEEAQCQGDSIRAEEGLRSVFAVADVIAGFSAGMVSGHTQSAQLHTFVQQLVAALADLEAALALQHGKDIRMASTPLTPTGKEWRASPRAGALSMFDTRPASFTSPIAAAASPSGSTLPRSPYAASSTTTLASLAVSNGRLSAELDAARAEIDTLRMAASREKRHRLHAEKAAQESHSVLPQPRHDAHGLVPALLLTDAWDDSGSASSLESSHEVTTGP